MNNKELTIKVKELEEHIDQQNKNLIRLTETLPKIIKNITIQTINKIIQNNNE